MVFLIPLILLFAAMWGVEGALWAGPVADTLAFILAVIFVILEFRNMKNDEKQKVKIS